tara:strand:- start:114 stop:755 length:642 start_codon:yes stop_codon:yes gene_type:complete
MSDLNDFAEGIFTGLTNAFEDTKKMIDGEANKTGDNIKNITGEVNTFFRKSAKTMTEGLKDIDNFVEKNRSRITEDVKNIVDAKRVDLQNAFTENNKKVSEMYSKTVCDKLCNKYNKIENIKPEEPKNIEPDNAAKVKDADENEILDPASKRDDIGAEETVDENNDFTRIGGKGKKSKKGKKGKKGKKTKKHMGGGKRKKRGTKKKKKKNKRK